MALVTVEQLFAGPFVTQLDFANFVIAFNAIIDGTDTVSAADKTYLDEDSDGTLTEDDRDYWLNQVISDNLQLENNRFPVSWTTPTNSDPLSLRGARPHVIIIDAQNPLAVRVRRSSNIITDQSDVAIPSSFLWGTVNGDTTSSTYNYLLWNRIQDWDEIGAVSRRRFPIDGSPVTIYIRGGNYTVDVELLIQLKMGSVNSKIIIRNYPGEVPVIKSGNSLWANGTVYRNTSVHTFNRPNIILRGIEWEGRRGSVGSYIFASTMVTFDTLATNFRIANNRFVKQRCLSTTHPQVASFPQFRDSQYDNRAATENGTLTNNDSLFLVKILSSTGKIDSNIIRQCEDDTFPIESKYGGEPLDIVDVSGIEVSNNCFSGIAPHAQIRVRKSSGTLSNILISENDIENLEHTCIICLSGTDITIQKNRIHNYVQLGAQSGNAIQFTNCSTSLITRNVIFNDGEPTFGWGIGLYYDFDVTGLTQSNEVSYNILYNTAFRVGYNSGYQVTGTTELANNEIYRNVIIGLPDSFLGTENDACVYVNMPNALANDFQGTTIHDNLIMRLDGLENKILGILQPSSTSLFYSVADQSPEFTLNFSSDPLFNDAENGDFRLLPGSPIADWFTEENTPLAYLSACGGVAPDPLPDPVDPTIPETTHPTIYAALFNIFDVSI